MKKVTISAHRGAPESAPENTLSAFQAAVSIGVDFIETDVHLSSDHHVVITHDPDFSRLGGPSKAIRNCTRDEIESFRLVPGPDGPEKPLFMDDALKLFPEVRFNVDLKDHRPEMAEAWFQLLVRSEGADRFRTASFDDRTLRYFRRLAPNLQIGIPKRRFLGLLLLAFLGLSRRPSAGEAVIQIPENAGILRLISRRTIKIWHRYGWKIEAWTIDNEDDMERLISWGIDGIITNFPSLLKKVLNQNRDVKPNQV